MIRRRIIRPIPGRQGVTGTPHGLDEAGLAARITELLPQPADQDVDRAREQLRIDAAQLVQDFVTAEGATGIEANSTSNWYSMVVRSSGLSSSSTVRRSVLTTSEPNFSSLSSPTFVRLRRSTFWMRATSSPRLEGFREIVVRTDFQADDAVGDVAAR